MAVWNETVEARFRETTESQLRESFRITCILAATLYPASTLLDWVTHRQEVVPLFGIRLAMAASAALLYALFNRVKLRASPAVLILLGLSSFSITAMCLYLEGYESQYWVGIMLPVLGAGVLLPLDGRQMTIAVGIELALYFLPVLAQVGFRPDDPSVFGYSSLFLGVAAIIAVSASWLGDRQRRESFGRLLETEQANLRLKSYDELKSRFFANVSHELRTPLTLIMGGLERMLDGRQTPQDTRRYVELAARNAQALLGRVNDLLDASKLEVGQMAVHYQKADLAEVTRRTCSMFEGVAASRRIEFGVEAPAALAAEVDVEKIQQVLVNLLSNAFKFVPEGRGIRCRLERKEDRALWAVADSGPGVPPEFREMIFERFRQIESPETRAHGGTGLGLAISRQLVQLQGGTIRVEETPGGGATFVVEVPVHAPFGSLVESARAPDNFTPRLEAVLGELTPAGGVTASPVIESAGRPRVLVVEDHPEMRSYIGDILRDDYQVSFASNGEEGLLEASEAPPDLILTDVMMPKLSGEQMTGRIRQQRALDEVPIVVLTAKDDDALRTRLLRRGVQDYLIKPFVASELLARVGNLVAMKRTREALRAELEETSLDVERLAVEVIRRKRETQESLTLAEEASATKSRFLTLVSHELRTPLTVIGSKLFLLRRQGTPNPEQSKCLDDIGRASLRILKMVESLLEYSAAEGGRIQTHLEPVDPLAIAREVVEDYRAEAEAKKLELRVVGSDPARPLLTDRRLLQLVVSRLVDNAVRFTEHGWVEVRVRFDGDVHELQVVDSGIGIQPEDLAAIFEPMEQLESISRKHKSGLGLGLAVVREIVRTLGGEVSAASIPGSGSTFSVRLHGLVLSGERGLEEGPGASPSG